MSEVTIHFDNPREAQDIAAQSAEMIATIERAFDVSLTTRETWLKIEGRGTESARPAAGQRRRSQDQRAARRGC